MIKCQYCEREFPMIATYVWHLENDKLAVGRVILKMADGEIA